MDYKAIINLMKEMNQTELTKLEVEEAGFKISMEKGTVCTCAAAEQPEAIQPVMPSITYQMTAPSQPAQEASAKEAGKQAEKPEETSGKKILSPMVGTFYSQSSPDKPAFVKVGDKIRKGQTICIIEAMKLMNEIESEYDGKITKILVNNEDMVEFGQPLFEIIP